VGSPDKLFRAYQLNAAHTFLTALERQLPCLNLGAAEEWRQLTEYLPS